jgi:hypothetical protein
MTEAKVPFGVACNSTDDVKAGAVLATLLFSTKVPVEFLLLMNFAQDWFN